MADSLSIYTIPWIKSFIKTSVVFSRHFKDKRQRKRFIDFLKLISLTGSPLLTDISSVRNDIKHYSRSLSHFFNKSDWNPHYFELKRKELVSNNLLKDCEIIALDSTALAKTGRHFENEGAVYDSRINKLTDGFPLLISTGITKQKHYSPISYLRYSHKDLESLSENQIKVRFIKDLISLFKNKAKIPIFIADSGFMRLCIVVLFLINNIPFLVRTSKRIVILKSGKRVLTNQLKSGIYSDVRFETRAWENIKCNLVVGLYDKDKGERRVFLTNLSLKDYSKTFLLKLYNQRWFIEESIKELKQQFGLEGFRIRSWKGSERFLTLLFFAVTLTHLSLKRHNDWIQYVLPYLLDYSQAELSFSIYYCRKIFNKILFCGPNILNLDILPLKQVNSP